MSMKQHGGVFGRNPKFNTIETQGNARIGGNIIVQPGKGIDFSATTHPAGMASELFSDYEEGTFTPAVVGTSTSGSGTYSWQIGNYTKVGRVVHFVINLYINSHTGTGDIQITGLPFVVGQAGGAKAVYVNTMSFTGTFLQAFVASTDAFIRQVSSGGSAGGVPIQTGCQIAISGHYEV